MKRRILKHAGIVVAAVVLGFPAGFVMAVMTSPFWGWFEKTTGIESLGHGGPDDWVFWMMFGLCMILFFAVLELTFRRERHIQSTSR